MVYKKYHQNHRFAETEARMKCFVYRNRIHKSWILFHNNELKTFSILWDNQIEMRVLDKNMCVVGGAVWLGLPEYAS